MSTPITQSLSGDSSSSTITQNDIPEFLNNVPFPPKHLNLQQILEMKPHRRKSKDTDTQKRTINSFLLYRKECSEHIKDKKIDNIKQKELSRWIAISWSLQPGFVKDHYKNLADQAKQLHKEISPQIQIRLYNPNNKSNSSEEENKDDIMQTDTDDTEINSPKVINYNPIPNENDPIIENNNPNDSNDWFATLSDINNFNDNSFASFASFTTGVNDDSLLFQNQLCGFLDSSLTYHQNLYVYHLCKFCLQTRKF
ncbi:hypothetical protein C1645_747999 [Glomus cerebriforme]|uniref:HMG box domain-containing protein n=1 Tax=Glomus cerebriforme TaxID=658196 RepID=A0A397TR72_9GLOM|nr:hypothetical protein C1645_747999 [Glomus cerebriforme]